MRGLRGRANYAKLPMLGWSQQRNNGRRARREDVLCDCEDTARMLRLMMESVRGGIANIRVIFLSIPGQDSYSLELDAFQLGLTAQSMIHRISLMDHTRCHATPGPIRSRLV